MECSLKIIGLRSGNRCWWRRLVGIDKEIDVLSSPFSVHTVQIKPLENVSAQQVLLTAQSSGSTAMLAVTVLC